MTDKRVRGKGPDWLGLVNAGDDNDPEDTGKPTPRGGQRKQAKSTAPDAPERAPQPPGATLPTPVVHQRQTNPKTSQFNVRIPVDLIDRMTAEVEEYDAQGLTRRKGDIATEALRLYYEMKDGNTP